MVKTNKHYNTIDAKEFVNIDVSDSSIYPDGKYDIKATFQENDYYNKSTKILSPLDGEEFTTIQTSLTYSTNGESYSNINNTNINGKYYDKTKIYIKLKAGNTFVTETYTLNIKLYKGQILLSDINKTGSNVNPIIIDDLYSLDVGSYKLVITYEPDSEGRVTDCTGQINYTQAQNTVAFYNFVPEGNSGVYSDRSNNTLNTYIDEIDTVRQQLRTVDGNRSIPNNIEIELKENDNVIQTITTFNDVNADPSLIGDTNGCILFNPEFATGTPTPVAIGSFSITGDNKEHIVEMNTNSYSITIGNYIKINIGATEQTIIIDNTSSKKDKLTFRKNLSITTNHKVYITKHGNIFRIMVLSGSNANDNLLLSLPKSLVSSNVNFSVNPVKINRYNLSELTSNNLVYNTEYTFNIKNDNLVSSNDKLIINKLELLYDDNYTYLVDGYHLDKVVNFFSTISLSYQPANSSGLEIGYSVNDIQEIGNSFKIKDKIPYATYNVDYYMKFYIKKAHSCMQILQIIRQIYPIDWKVTTTAGQLSHPNINLSITDSNGDEITEPIEPSETFNINCNVGIRNKSISILRKASNSSYQTIYTGTTGENGKFSKTNLTDTNEGTFYYKAQGVENTGEMFESDVEYPLTIIYRDTSLTFNALTKLNYNLEESITLTTVAKRNVNGSLQNITDSISVKYYLIVGSNEYELETKTTTNGQTSITYNLINFRTNGYPLNQDIKFKAVLIGDENYNTTTAYSSSISISKITYNLSLSSNVETSEWGKGAILSAIVKNASTNAYISGATVEFFDYNNTSLGTVNTNSSGLATKTISLPGYNQNAKPNNYVYRAVVSTDNYSTASPANKTITTTKRAVLLNPLVNHVKSLVQGGTVPSQGIDAIFYGWEQRFKLIEAGGETLKGTNNVTIEANDVPYNKQINSSGIVGLKIRLHTNDGRGGDSFNEVIKCTYDGNDWYQSASTQKTAKYLLNDTIYASPGTIEESETGGSISWEPQYLTAYNLRWDTVQGGQWWENGQLVTCQSDNYLLSGNLPGNGNAPKKLLLKGWNVGSNYSFNRGNFIYESDIISMSYIVEDMPYKDNVNNNHPQINNFWYSFGSDIPSFYSNTRYINGGFDSWGYRAYLYWNNEATDSDGHYLWLDETINNEEVKRVIPKGTNNNSDFNPTNFTQAKLLNTNFTNVLNYGDVDNGGIGRQMLLRAYFVIIFIPKQIDISLES